MTVGTLFRGASGNLFVVGYSNGMVKLYTSDEPRLVASVQAHSRQVSAIACHPSKQLFATVGDDTFMNVWEVPKNSIDVSLNVSARANDMQLTGVCFAGSEGVITSVVASVYDYKSILVWDDVL